MNTALYVHFGHNLLQMHLFARLSLFLHHPALFQWSIPLYPEAIKYKTFCKNQCTLSNVIILLIELGNFDKNGKIYFRNMIFPVLFSNNVYLYRNQFAPTLANSLD